MYKPIYPFFKYLSLCSLFPPISVSFLCRLCRGSVTLSVSNPPGMCICFKVWVLSGKLGRVEMETKPERRLQSKSKIHPEQPTPQQAWLQLILMARTFFLDPPTCTFSRCLWRLGKRTMHKKGSPFALKMDTSTGERKARLSLV